MKRRILLGLAAPILALVASVPNAEADAIRLNAGFNTSSLAANDDGSTGAVNIGFNLNFFGVNQNFAYLNNNGNITFTGPLATFTPFSLLTTATPIIAPFFADIDTRGASNLMRYGASTVDGYAAFGVNWINVGYFPSSPRPNRNSLQLVLINRSDVAAGDFDFEFNYDQIQFEAGTASGSDNNGCGGSSARAGYSNGSNADFELPGSAIDGAFIDSGLCYGGVDGPNALITHSLNSNVAGRYVFNVRSGVVDHPRVPEPGSLLLLGSGIAIVGRRLLRRKSRA